MKRFALLAGVLSIVILAPLALRAQAPQQQQQQRFKNLKVFPKGTPRDSLLDAMRGFTQSLGVRCDHCHMVRKTGSGRDSLDFASDEKKMKSKARFMMRMVSDLNRKTLSKLPERSHPPVLVTCTTCHRGSAVPRTIDVVLAQVADSSGAAAAVQRYRQLRQETMEEGRFDFSEMPVNELARRLARRGRADDAIALLGMNAEFHPKSSQIDVEFAEIYRARGDTAQAMARYRAALEKDPGNRQARRRLDELTGAPAPGH